MNHGLSSFPQQTATTHWTSAHAAYLKEKGIVWMMRERIDQEKALVVFEGKQIRRTWHDDTWYFSVVDVVGVLSDSADARNYWKVLKHRLTEEGTNETVTKCNQLKLPAEDGK